MNKHYSLNITGMCMHAGDGAGGNGLAVWRLEQNNLFWKEGKSIM